MDLHSWLAQPIQSPVLNWDRSCNFCHVRLLSSERAVRPFCCGGAVRANQYTPLPPLPPEYDVFINHSSISAQSRSLNLLFSFASLESTHEFPTTGNNISFVVVQGRIYHRIRPEHGSSAIRWILYDGFELNRAPPFNPTQEDLPLAWINAVRQALSRDNPLVRTLLHMSIFVHNPNRHAHIELLDSNTPEIAAVMRFDSTTLNDIEPRRLIIRKRNNRNQSISATSSLWEPLSYPLLFPHATTGWGVREGDFSSYSVIFFI